MKRTVFIVIAAVCSIFAVSCKTEMEVRPAEERIPVNLSGSLNQLAETKANANGFEAGDRVGVYVVNYRSDLNPGTLAVNGNQVNNVAYTKGDTWVPDYAVYYKDNSTHVDFYAYYPYVADITSVSELPWTVKEDQNIDRVGNSLGAYEESDFLWAKRENIVPSSANVVLPFKHRMSQICVTLQKGSGFGDEWAGLPKQVLISNVKRNATIDLSTGAVTAVGEVSARHTVPYLLNDAFRAIVVPQEMAANTVLFTITVDGVAYAFKENTAFTYIQGKQHNFTITVNKKADGTYEFAASSAIRPWDDDARQVYLTSKEYVVVNLTGASTESSSELAEKLSAMGVNISDVKNLKLTGVMSIYDWSTILSGSISALNLSEITEMDYEGRTYLTLNGNWRDLDYRGASQYWIPLWNYTSLKTIMFPENATLLYGSLEGTSLGGSIILPNGLKNLKLRFKGTNLSSINLPNQLEVIDEWVFYGCKYLSMDLILPKTLKKIGPYAFTGCTGLTGYLDLPEGLEELGHRAFNSCNGLSGRLVIPPKITVIQEATFTGCSGLTSLYLHDGIKQIKAWAFEACSALGGELVLPQGLLSIGESAFYGNSFSGVLEIPQEVSAIPSSCFACNSNYGFSEIIIPEELSAIGDNAFGNQNKLTLIRSLAQDPPAIQSGSFSKVAISKAILEVPNQKAVSDYYSVTGWSAFTNIFAPRDFSVDTDRIEALNDAMTTTVKLEAGETAHWAVALSDGASGWVTVSPESGTGPATLTVNISELPAGGNRREATVTYVLTGDDYTATTLITQSNYTPNDPNKPTNPLYLDNLDGSVLGNNMIVPVWTHTVGSGIPIVFTGDGFSASEVSNGTFLQNMKRAIRYFFDPEPYFSYKDYFDVYILVAVSRQSGIGTPHIFRSTHFGTCLDIMHQLVPNPAAVFNHPSIVANGLNTSKLMAVVVTNVICEEGVSFVGVDGRTVSYCPLSPSTTYPNDFGGNIQFEAGGRGFGRLGDERVRYNMRAQGDAILSLRAAHQLNCCLNLSESPSISKVPWKHLITDSRYKDIVDVYEGGMGFTKGIFRSEGSSCMSNKIAYYNTISREAIVKRIKALAGESYSFEDFKLHDVTTPHNETRLNGGI